MRTGRDPLIHEEQLAPMLLALFDPWLEKLPDAAFDQFVQHLDRRCFCTTGPNHGQIIR